jgi:hypothetical protein
MAAPSGTGAVERVRQLGAVEYLLDTLEQQAGGHLVRVIDVEGPVDVELLETAFRRLVARRPILRTRIDRPDGERPAFVLDEAVTPEFSVVERRDADHWEREFDEQLVTRIGAEGGAPVRARVLASGSAGGEIIVSAAHSVSDGRSLFGFCRDLIEEYEVLWRDGEDAATPPAGTIAPPLESLLPEWLGGPRLHSLTEGFVARQAAVSEDPIVMFPFSPDDSGVPATSHVISYSLPAAETAALRRGAHDAGTSVTGAIAAAEMQALAELSRPPVGQWIVPVVTIDMRPHLRDAVPTADMGAYVGTVFSRHVDVGAVATWTLARDVTTQLTESLDRGDQLMLAALGEQFVDQFVTVDRPLGPLVLANLGRQELPSGPSVLRPRSIRGGSPVHRAKYPAVQCQAVTTGGVLWLTFVYNAPALRHDLARDFGASVVERLVSLARPSRPHSA